MREILRQMRRNKAAYLFITPSLIAFMIFVFVPLVWTFLLTFQRGDLLSRSYAGFTNYKEVFKDNLFQVTLKNTLHYAFIAVPSVIIISLLLAVFLDGIHNRIFQNTFRAIICLPLLAPVAVIAIIWQAMYHPQGILNEFLALLNIQPFSWLGNPNVVLKSIAAVEIWRGAGFYVVVFLAALQGIPKDLYEAANIDGASNFRIFWNITLPLLKPSLLFCIVMATIWNFQLFDSVYVLTSGGPAYSSSTIVWYIYQNAFNYGQIGYASTMALILMLIIMVFSILQTRMLRD